MSQMKIVPWIVSGAIFFEIVALYTLWGPPYLFLNKLNHWQDLAGALIGTSVPIFVLIWDKRNQRNQKGVSSFFDWKNNASLR